MGNIQRAESMDAHWNHNCELPHGLKVEEVQKAVEDIYNFFFRMNSMLTQEKLEFFESLVLGNTLSGMLSELIVKRVAVHSQTLERNIRVGGHPDLLVKGKYPGGSIQRGEEGIEVKCSKQSGGWQGHNPEACWLIVFRYVLGDPLESPEKRSPIQFVQILCGCLTVEDWSLAERGQDSRRTRTTSINQKGMHKLRTNPIYQNPSFVVGGETLKKQYLALHQGFAKA
jgi:hypothetical protein